MPSSRNAITRKLRKRKSPKAPATVRPKTGGLSRQQRRRKRLLSGRGRNA